MKGLRVWVLIPIGGQAGHAALDTYYDFSSMRAELDAAFGELGIEDWRWLPVTLDDYAEHIAAICATEEEAKACVLNFCDGDGINGYPGPEVAAELERSGLPFAGAGSEFYGLTTSKIVMKQAFEDHGVPTAAWSVVAEDADEARFAAILERLDGRGIVKPAVSGGRMGIGLRSVVETPEQLHGCLDWLRGGVHGWDTVSGGIFVERFIAGREFTVLLAGAHDRPEARQLLCPVERVFHPSLPERERICTFERAWFQHDEEAPLAGNAPSYSWARVEPELDEALRALAWDAYAAVRGTSFGRVDIRMAADSGELFVLEVNSQPGLTGNYDPVTGDAVGHIFHVGELSFAAFLGRLLRDAVDTRT